MKKQTPKRKKDWLDDPEVIVFAGGGFPSRQPIMRTLVANDKEFLKTEALDFRPERILPGEFDDPLRGLFGVKKGEVRADWQKVVGQIRSLLDGVSAVTKDYDLDEITFELGFSAEGKIIFVAKAGVTTSISAKFKRRK